MHACLPVWMGRCVCACVSLAVTAIFPFSQKGKMAVMCGTLDDWALMPCMFVLPGDRRGNTRQLLAYLRAQKRQSKVYNRMKLMVVGLQVRDGTEEGRGQDGVGTGGGDNRWEGTGGGGDRKSEGTGGKGDRRRGDRGRGQ